MDPRPNLDELLRESLQRTREAQARSEAKRRRRRPHDVLGQAWAATMREKFGDEVPVVTWGVVEVKLIKALIKEVGLELAERVVRRHVLTCETPAVKLMWALRQKLILEIRREDHRPGEWDDGDDGPSEGW